MGESDFKGDSGAPVAEGEEGGFPTPAQGDANLWEERQGPTGGGKGRRTAKEESVPSHCGSTEQNPERCGRTRKVVRSACAVVGAEGEDIIVKTLKELPQRQVVLDLESKNAKLKEEVKRLKEELEDKKKQIRLQ